MLRQVLWENDDRIEVHKNQMDSDQVPCQQSTRGRLSPAKGHFTTSIKKIWPQTFCINMIFTEKVHQCFYIIKDDHSND